MSQSSEISGTITTKANVYFDGKVVSHSVVTPDGKKRTVGVMYPGTYHFNTNAAERMDIQAGRCRVKIGAADWRTVEAGHHFLVDARSGFDIVIDAGLTEYVCSFE